MHLKFQPNGERVIREAIARAHEKGETVATVSGNYEIAETVLLPSETTLVLRDCHLRMQAGTFCQMFRNAHAETPGVTDREIHIRGEGRAILDGGEYNGLSERNSGKDGLPLIIANNLLLFADVEHFSVTGIKAQNQRWWALNFIACRHGLLRDIDFESDAVWIDPETGEEHFGLTSGHYNFMRVHNSDGIDLRIGCHDILIENITGFTEDDTVALTALPNFIESAYPLPEGMRREISDVIIRNVRSSTICSNVRLLAQGGTKLYNILVDGVTDVSKDDPHLDFGGYGVRIGDPYLYGSRQPTREECFNITVRNVTSRADVAVLVAGEIENLRLENIAGFDRCKETVVYK